MKKISYLFLIAIPLVFFVSSCASTNPSKIPYKGTIYQSSGKSIYANLKPSSNFQKRYINLINYSQPTLSMNETISKSRLFVVDQNNSDYQIKATVIKLHHPSFGLDITTTMTIQYDFMQGNSVLHSTTIDSQYTTKYSEAFVGVKRSKMSVQGAIRENTKKYLKQLSVQLPENKEGQD